MTVLTILALCAFSSAFPPEDPERIDFASEIRPILSDRCFQCHGPDAGKVAADLRLDDRESAIDDLARFPAAIVPGDSAASELLSRITHESARRRMPPPESNLTLTAEEIALLARWIDEGAEYTEHWSFVRPERTATPALASASEASRGWARDPLDHHVLARLAESGLTPAEEADPSTLLRRVHLDLTGLPPTHAQLDAFLADPSDAAYEAIVLDLLASPRHAEHRAAGWLDLSRYADTFGYQSDQNMNVWPWRDWVLGAFEKNLPHDEFIVHQLAGDLIPDADQDTRLATAFNRLHRQTNEGGSVEEEYRVESVCDRVETMASAFLGLTVGCARCHDHKFDPITQRDYFSLFAFFDDIDESGLYSHFTNAVPTPALDLPTEAQAAQLAELEARVAELEAAPSRRYESSLLVDLPSPLVVDFEPGTEKGAGDGAEPKELYRLNGPLEVPVAVEGPESPTARRLSGENSITFPGAGVFQRSDPFSIGLRLWVPDDPDMMERAVVLHRTKSWTDSGSRGYQVLIEDGHITVSLVHFWPGDAICIRAKQPLAAETWTHVAFTYDGSSRASGLTLYVDHEPVEVEVVRDHLTRTIRGGSIGDLAIGSRFRDKGLRGGAVDDVWVAAYVAAGMGLPFPRTAEELASLKRPNLLHHEQEELRLARAERDKLRDSIRQIMTMEASPDLAAARHVAHVLERGEYAAKGDEVGPATPEALPTFRDTPFESRLDLARWLVHPDHPLTSRVHVDRLWRLAFGVGLVATPEDLGSQSPVPEHLALLDTLSRDLVESGWDSRAMLRRFVTSATYRQSSRGAARSETLDPDGRLFSRAAKTRRSAEVVRDAALLAAGLLHEERGGPSVFPFQPPGLWQEKRGVTYPTSRGTGLVRRSLYTFWRRTSPPPTMTMFNAPSREVCTVKRASTSTPLQTLVLWNDPQFVAVATALGARAVAVSAGDDGARVDHLFKALLTRIPEPGEREAMTGLLREQRAVYRGSLADAVALANFDLERAAHGEGLPEDPTLQGVVAIEVAATAVVASTLLSFEDVKLRR